MILASGPLTFELQKQLKDQPTDLEILSALNEMLQSKTELKAEKVELAVVDDIKKLYSDYIGQNEEYDKIYAPISKVEGDVQNWIKGMEKIKSKAETLFKNTDKMMKELGVRDMPFLDDLSKIIDDKIVLAHAKAQLTVLKKF